MAMATTTVSTLLLLLFLLAICITSTALAAGSSNQTWHAAKGSPQYLQLFVEETSWYNRIVLGPLGLHDLDWMPHFLTTWLRNYIAGLIVYFLSGGLWCLYIYYLKPQIYFPNGGIPKSEPIWLQIKVSMKAMPLYSLLPTISEFMVEQGWTKCYARIGDVGFANYILLSAAYLTLVEFGIYWMHRGLHDIKPLYKMLHATHHIYNKQDTLSPFAGLAFHPIDGILQALPHVLVLFIIPMHFFTHEFFLFLEGIWTTNIHDCIDGKVWPIMGAAYHTIHHTTYRHNYGHYTVWMDWMCGTLNEPPRPTNKLAAE